MGVPSSPFVPIKNGGRRLLQMKGWALSDMQGFYVFSYFVLAPGSEVWVWSGFKEQYEGQEPIPQWYFSERDVRTVGFRDVYAECDQLE